MEKTFSLKLAEHGSEINEWKANILPCIENVSGNVEDILSYGFTEIYNNALIHAGADSLEIRLDKTASDITVSISDNGIGIFSHLKNQLSLYDESEAAFELLKGKVTTAPEDHTGQGLFFSLRLFDNFRIISKGKILSSHNTDDNSCFKIQSDDESLNKTGTTIEMNISPVSQRKTEDVFGRFTEYDEKEGIQVFTKTVFPLALAEAKVNLISRAQAQRITRGLEKFSDITIDCAGVESTGHSFWDELLRVWHGKHSDSKIRLINLSEKTFKIAQFSIGKRLNDFLEPHTMKGRVKLKPNQA